jgi:ketosteroid isomerase-like protein
MPQESVQERLDAIVDAYERGVNEGDLDLIMSLFHDDAVFYDPVGWLDAFTPFTTPSPPGVQPGFVGRENLERFFGTVAQSFPALEYKVGRRFFSVDPPGIAFQWSGYSAKEGQELHVSAVDVFHVDDGKIRAVYGYIANPDTFVYRATEHV